MRSLAACRQTLSCAKHKCTHGRSEATCLSRQISICIAVELLARKTRAHAATQTRRRATKHSQRHTTLATHTCDRQRGLGRPAVVRSSGDSLGRTDEWAARSQEGVWVEIILGTFIFRPTGSLKALERSCVRVAQRCPRLACSFFTTVLSSRAPLRPRTMHLT